MSRSIYTLVRNLPAIQFSEEWLEPVGMLVVDRDRSIGRCGHFNSVRARGSRKKGRESCAAQVRAPKDPALDWGVRVAIPRAARLLSRPTKSVGTFSRRSQRGCGGAKGHQEISCFVL